MAGNADHWSGRAIRRWLFAIWATASLAMCARSQYTPTGDLGWILYGFGWAAAFVALAVVTTLVAGIKRSWGDAGRSIAESTAIFLATITAMFGLEWTSKELGLGHWPPRDGEYERRFRERRGDWLAERDRVL